VVRSDQWRAGAFMAAVYGLRRWPATALAFAPTPPAFDRLATGLSNPMPCTMEGLMGNDGESITINH
jgi:hypothetical protein